MWNSEMIPIGTRAALIAWARWGAMKNLSYPTLSPMFGERALKTPLHESTWAPPDVLEVDKAMGLIEPDERRMLIHRYLWHMTHAEIAERWGISKGRARHLLEHCEYAFHAMFVSLNSRPKSAKSDQADNSVPTGAKNA